MIGMPAEAQASPEAAARERFVRDTADHRMEVLHDDGLYRHLRFRAPSTSAYWFDLVTWPGRLVVCGDVGDYMFSRLADMFMFFGDRGSSQGFESEQWGINAYYWGEKLRGASHGREQTKTYDEQRYKAQVRQWFEGVADGLDADERTRLEEAVNEQLLDIDSGELGDEGAVRTLLREFEHDGLHIDDSWEWDLCEWDWSYLWCLWAIVWGIDRYRAARPAEVPA